MENNNNETFNYTYSADTQDEIRAIREKYTKSEKIEDKMTVLRNLDKRVTKKASTVALTIGTVGALIMGLGMSLAMSDFGKILGSYDFLAMFLGIIIGVVGIALVCAAYPIYNHTVKKERKKIAPEIIKLTDELMK